MKYPGTLRRPIKTKPNFGSLLKGRLGLFLSAILVVCAGLIGAPCASGQGDDTPTGLSGGFGGSITTGGGSFDPYERNASRSVTDIVVPGAVVPFTYTRTWNSRSGWRDNWSWGLDEIIASESSSNDSNSLFKGYNVYYPDGRVIKFNKPQQPANSPELGVGAPGTYKPDASIQDRLVVQADGTRQLIRTDGSVVNFTGPDPTSIVDPHGLAVTYSYDATGATVTEPGGRWIHIGVDPIYENPSTHTVTTSLGQTVTYTMHTDTSGYYPYECCSGDPDGESIRTSRETVVYNDVLDPNTGAPVEAHYVYKTVWPPPQSYGAPRPTDHGRLIWASDPMFDGPLQQIKYTYVDNTSAPTGDVRMSAVLEERWAPNYWDPNAPRYRDPGTLVMRVEMLPWTYTALGDNSEGYYARQETTGYGGVRTISYYNPTAVYSRYNGTRFQQVVGGGQTLVDHFTDFTNDPRTVERHEYDWATTGSQPQFQTPTKITDPLQNVTSQVLEPVLGHLTRQTHEGDTSYRAWTYTDPAHPYYLWTSQDELGNVTTYTRWPTTNLVKHIDHSGAGEDFEYNEFNQVKSHTLPSGAVVTSNYDTRGLLQWEYNSVDGWDARKEYTYDALDRVRTMTDGRARSSGAPYSVKMEYNARHQVTKVHYPPTGASSDPTVSYGYDAWGNCTSITDELGHTSTYEYDVYRRCTSYTEPLNASDWNNGPNVPSRRWDWLYDRYIEGIGPRDALTHTSKEWHVQIEPAFNAAGERRMTARNHDLNNRMVLEETGYIQAGNLPIGNWYTGPDTEIHYFSYDEMGHKKSYTDPRGRVTTYDYDNRNRLWKTNETVNSVQRTTEILYDTVGNKTDVKFPVEATGQRTQKWRNYDAFGQAWTFIDERNNTTNLTYCWGPMKKLYTVTTHRGKDTGGIEDQLTTFSYDLMGKATQVFFPDGSHEDTNYQCTDSASYLCDQPHRWWTRKGQLKTINYDARGREISHTWSDDTPGVTRTWDDASRLMTIANSVATLDYSYDDAGQPKFEGTTIAGSGNYTHVNYLRYPDGNVSHMQYPNGVWVRHDYTSRGQLQAVYDNTGGYWKLPITYNYLPDGKVNYEVYRPGSRTDFTYDERGFTKTVRHSNSAGEELAMRTYYRDERDRITSFQKGSNNPKNPMEDGRGDHYWYDAEGQLTDAYYGAIDPVNSPNNPVRVDYFPYDALGNRQGWNFIASRGGWLNFNTKDTGLNQYSGWWPYCFTKYDDDLGEPFGTPGRANGVLMEEGSMAISYNALNQPKLAWSNATQGGYLWFGFDPLGRCVKRWYAQADGSGATPVLYFVYDGWNLVQEGTSPWNPSHFYFHGARVDEIVASYNGVTGVMAYHYYDASGHCTMLTDAQGNIMEQYYYDAFGYPYFFDGLGSGLGYSPHGNRFLFTGREWIDPLKVYDFRNRLYHPELGRFMQPDPKEFAAGDYNLYRYCHNDPVNHSDPMGLTIFATGTAEFIQRVKDEVQELFDSHPELRSAIAELAFDPNRAVTIAHADSSDNPLRPDSGGKGHKGNHTVGLAGETHYSQKQDSRIYYNPDNWTDGKGRHRPPIVALTHELGHALDYSHGTWTLNSKAGAPIVEERGIWWENITRDRLQIGRRGWNNYGFNPRAEPDDD